MRERERGFSKIIFLKKVSGFSKIKMKKLKFQLIKKKFLKKGEDIFENQRERVSQVVLKKLRNKQKVSQLVETNFEKIRSQEVRKDILKSNFEKDKIIRYF